MSSEWYERGRRDAEADALDESFYQYYYDYRRAYDAVVKQRRRGERRMLLARLGRAAIWFVPLLLLVSAGSLWAYRQNSTGPVAPLISFVRNTPTTSPSRTPRPTLPLPSATPSTTPTSPPILRADSFAVVTNTGKAPLNMRASPSRKAALVAKLSPGKRVKILEGPRIAEGITWWRVEGEQGKGWAAGDYLAPVAIKP